jgi:hypothetical protein
MKLKLRYIGIPILVFGARLFGLYYATLPFMFRFRGGTPFNLLGLLLWHGLWLEVVAIGFFSLSWIIAWNNTQHSSIFYTTQTLYIAYYILATISSMSRFDLIGPGATIALMFGSVQLAIGILLVWFLNRHHLQKASLMFYPMFILDPFIIKLLYQHVFHLVSTRGIKIP